MQINHIKEMEIGCPMSVKTVKKYFNILTPTQKFLSQGHIQFPMLLARLKKGYFCMVVYNNGATKK